MSWYLSNTALTAESLHPVLLSNAVFYEMNAFIVKQLHP